MPSPIASSPCSPGAPRDDRRRDGRSGKQGWAPPRPARGEPPLDPAQLKRWFPKASLWRGPRFQALGAEPLALPVNRSSHSAVGIEAAALEGPREDEVLVRITRRGVCGTDRGGFFSRPMDSSGPWAGRT